MIDAAPGGAATSDPAAPATAPGRGLTPVPPAARVLALDVLRGIALFGVLLVNLGVFSGALWATEAGISYPAGPGGHVLDWLCRTFLEGKAAALLAMLFGTGLAIQLEAAERAGRPYAPFALRRAGALALFGLAHSVLLWNVDILLDYAVISLLVQPVLGLSPARLLWAIPGALAASLAIALPITLHGDALDPAELYRLGAAHYGAGSWLDALRYRTSELVHVIGPMRLSSRPPALAPFFVLGVYAWKRGWFAAPARHRRALRALLVGCGALGLLANLAPPEVLHPWLERLGVRPLRIAIKLIAFFARPALTVGYAAAILLLLQRPWWRARLSALAPLGRVALTQYLLQSVVCTLVFNGYGLGLYGALPLDICYYGGIGLFAAQVWTSRRWIARYPVGPAEWLWRRLSYPPRPARGLAR